MPAFVAFVIFQVIHFVSLSVIASPSVLCRDQNILPVNLHARIGFLGARG